MVVTRLRKRQSSQKQKGNERETKGKRKGNKKREKKGKRKGNERETIGK